MPFGIQLLTSRGVQNIASIQDIGLRLVAATDLTNNPGNVSSIWALPSDNNNGLIPSSSGSFAGPPDFNIHDSGYIFIFLDIFNGSFFPAGSYAGVWEDRVRFSWNNSTKILSWTSIPVQSGTPGRASAFGNSPHIGNYKVWFLYGDPS
jgi:hypothetical protein